MALTTSQKHELMINFNNQRKKEMEEYAEIKQAKKTAKAEAAAAAGGAATSPEEAALAPQQYKKLYKQLGMNTGCKDVRNLL